MDGDLIVVTDNSCAVMSDLLGEDEAEVDFYVLGDRRFFDLPPGRLWAEDRDRFLVDADAEHVFFMLLVVAFVLLPRMGLLMLFHGEPPSSEAIEYGGYTENSPPT
jgi:hypothetical protein